MNATTVRVTGTLTIAFPAFHLFPPVCRVWGMFDR
jgi:hypothetical protein